MNDRTPQCGDELHTRGNGAFHRLQAWFVELPREDPTLSTHVAAFVSNSKIIEAVSPKVREVEWPIYKAWLNDNGFEWCILRMEEPPLSEDDQAKFRSALQSAVGHSYSKVELVGQALDGLISKVFCREVHLFRNLVDVVPQTVICSGLIGHAWVQIGRLQSYMGRANPDELWDFREEQMVIGEVRSVDHSRGWTEPFDDLKDS